MLAHGAVGQGHPAAQPRQGRKTPDGRQIIYTLSCAPPGLIHPSALSHGWRRGLLSGASPRLIPVLHNLGSKRLLFATGRELIKKGNALPRPIGERGRGEGERSHCTNLGIKRSPFQGQVFPISMIWSDS